MAGRTNVKGTRARPSRGKRIPVPYAHKLAVVQYLESHKMAEGITEFYPELNLPTADPKAHKQKSCRSTRV